MSLVVLTNRQGPTQFEQCFPPSGDVEVKCSDCRKTIRADANNPGGAYVEVSNFYETRTFSVCIPCSYTWKAKETLFLMQAIKDWAEEQHRFGAFLGDIPLPKESGDVPNFFLREAAGLHPAIRSNLNLRRIVWYIYASRHNRRSAGMYS